ncbi:MAG TPA: deoxyribonuclease IV [Solirubrobacterales bacterium]
MRPRPHLRGRDGRRPSGRVRHLHRVADLLKPVGAHLAPEEPLAEAEAVGAECLQLFLSHPQTWRKPPPRADAEELRDSKLDVYVHAPYLINVCSPKSNIRYGSRKILQQTCEAAAAVGAAAVIVHAGYAEDGIDAGVGRWPRTLEMLESEVPVLIENTAGGENAVARRFDALAKLWDAIAAQESDVELGFCFDTCHAHSAGEDLADAVERVLGIVGAIDLLHANDSKDPAGSGRDRHQNLGAGEVGADRLRAMIRAAGAPVVCETPGSAADLVADMEFVRDALSRA